MRRSGTNRIIRRVTGALELPKETALNLPVITMTGAEELLIENYRGLVEYTGELVRIYAGAFTVRVEGTGLVLARVAAEFITVCGRITNVAFVY